MREGGVAGVEQGIVAFCLITCWGCFFVVFFFNATATTEIYTLPLHDALPISAGHPATGARHHMIEGQLATRAAILAAEFRSEEHTSELQVTDVSRMPSSA